jgi:IS5 family transposase
LVLADKIYLNRPNRKYLKDRNIKHGAPPVGRRGSLTKNEKDKRRKINNKRSEIEGKFGQTKLKYGLDDLFTRLPQTIFAEINLIFLAVNLLKVVAGIFSFIFSSLQDEYKSLRKQLKQQIIKCWEAYRFFRSQWMPQMALDLADQPSF